jgi:hypothetical protein
MACNLVDDRHPARIAEEGMFFRQTYEDVAPSCRLAGRVTAGLELLAELGRPVWDRSGTRLVEGWQPADLARRFAPERTRGDHDHVIV